MPYQFASGYNNTAGLADWPLLTSKIPRVGGLKGGRRRAGGDGVIDQDGYQSCIVDYGFLTKAEVTTLYSSFGLDPENGTTSAKGTFKLPRNKDRTFTNYNGVIEALDPPSDGEFVRGRWLSCHFKIHRLKVI